MKKECYSLILLLIISIGASAAVRLPGIFGNHMVLQRDKPIPVWGWAQANEKITVQFNKQLINTKADKQGKWKIDLAAEQAGGPFDMTIKGQNTIVYTDVLIGEVWICSGQSNMEWTLRNTNDAAAEIASADMPMIHHITVTKAISLLPKDDIAGGSWNVCSPVTAGDFTAVGYYFAKQLYNELKVPVGLINTSWGGTHSETWTSKEAFENDSYFKDMIAGLPALRLDSLNNIKKAAALKHITELQGGFKTAAEIETWKESSANDIDWGTVKLPGVWEQQELGDIDGVVWFRKTINLTADDAGKPAQLELAMIDDNDIAYVNGVKVGSTNSYNTKRKYNIPAGVLKKGRNVIAVRVEDTGGGGGIYGESSDLLLTIGDSIILLAGEWKYQVEALSGAAASIGPNEYPTLLYNAMLYPLIPYAIQGAIWYQGESNAGRAYEYRKAFPLMITDWRTKWNQGNFPFYFVQLASFNSANGNSKNGSTWAELREAQTMTLQLPHTGMAITTDIGVSNDIHPRNKLDVGKRLAAIALHDVYGKQIEYSGPMYSGMQINGNTISISFTHTGKGLMAKDKYGYVKGFEIAGADKQFYYARAWIEGDKIIVMADEVKSPVAVRFGWTDDAGENNLFNKDGFPASPFRTDDWKGITEHNKFSFTK